MGRPLFLLMPESEKIILSTISLIQTFMRFGRKITMFNGRKKSECQRNGITEKARLAGCEEEYS